MMRMLANALWAALWAARVKRCRAMNRRESAVALAGVYMTCTAAAHHQVRYQQCDAQDTGRASHRTPLCLPVIRYRRQSLASFKQPDYFVGERELSADADRPGKSWGRKGRDPEEWMRTGREAT